MTEILPVRRGGSHRVNGTDAALLLALQTDWGAARYRLGTRRRGVVLGDDGLHRLLQSLRISVQVAPLDGLQKAAAPAMFCPDMGSS